MAPKLSFGVELEFILSFHESKILSYLQNGDSLVRDIESNEAQALVPEGYKSEVQHLSWAIVEEHTGSVRSYAEEPLKVAQNIISKVPGTDKVRVFFEGNYKTKHQDYSQWTILGDPSLQGLSKRELLSNFEDRIGTVSEWDSWGVELVSPVIPVTNIPKFGNQIQNLMHSLRGGPESLHGTAVSGHCGLHVHIGKYDNSDFDIRTLQYLALIIAIYEGEILRLCAPVRSKDPEFRKTNRENLFSEEEEVVVLKQYNESTGTTEENRHICKYISIQKIRELLGMTNSGNYDQKISQIIRTMGRWRGKFINFTYLDNKTGRNTGRPQTIEFRQHEATMNPNAITAWVKFCHGLVELAEKYASGKVTFPVQYWTDRVWFQDLFDTMELDPGTQGFFHSKLREQQDAGGLSPLEHLFYPDFEDELHDAEAEELYELPDLITEEHMI
jgi:Putative amidoligase enzyme